jgi:hypothetical protein
MALTWTEGKAIFIHLLDDVLDLDGDSSLRQSLSSLGIDDVFALLAIGHDTIDSLVYDKSPTNKGVPVKKANISMLKALFSYIAQLQGNNSLESASDWFLLTMQGYDDYRISPCNRPVFVCCSNTFSTVPKQLTPVVPTMDPTTAPIDDQMEKSSTMDKPTSYPTKEPMVEATPMIILPGPTMHPSSEHKPTKEPSPKLLTKPSPPCAIHTPQTSHSPLHPLWFRLSRSPFLASPWTPHHCGSALFGGEDDPTIFSKSVTPQIDSGLSKQLTPMFIFSSEGHESRDLPTKDLFRDTFTDTENEEASTRSSSVDPIKELAMDTLLTSSWPFEDDEIDTSIVFSHVLEKILSIPHSESCLVQLWAGVQGFPNIHEFLDHYVHFYHQLYEPTCIPFTDASLQKLQMFVAWVKTWISNHHHPLTTSDLLHMTKESTNFGFFREEWNDVVFIEVEEEEEECNLPAKNETNGQPTHLNLLSALLHDQHDPGPSVDQIPEHYGSFDALPDFDQTPYWHSSDKFGEAIHQTNPGVMPSIATQDFVHTPDKIEPILLDYGEPIIHVSKSSPQICASIPGWSDPNQAQLNFDHPQVVNLHGFHWDAFMAKPSTSTSKLTTWLSYGEQEEHSPMLEKCLTLTDFVAASYGEHKDSLHLDAILDPPWFLVDYPVVPWRKAPPWQLEIPNSFGWHHSLLPSSSPSSTERGVTNSEEEWTLWDMS